MGNELEVGGQRLGWRVMAVDVVMANEAQRLPLHDQVPAIEPGLLPERIVGLDGGRALLARQPAETLAAPAQLGQETLERAGDAGEGGGLLRAQLRFRPLQAFCRPLHRPHATTLPSSSWGVLAAHPPGSEVRRWRVASYTRGWRSSRFARFRAPRAHPLASRECGPSLARTRSRSSTKWRCAAIPLRLQLLLWGRIPLPGSHDPGGEDDLVPLVAPRRPDRAGEAGGRRIARRRLLSRSGKRLGAPNARRRGPGRR